MDCPECGKLFDAYLDAQLSGTMRLEFDTHRVRCTRCQQRVAMLETAGNVIAADQPPAIADDFTARVMADVERRRRRGRTIRLYVIAGLAQAAAVALFVIWIGGKPAVPAAAPTLAATGVPSRSLSSVELTDELEAPAIKKLIVERVEDRIWAMHAAGESFTSDVIALARYLNILLPDEVVRDSVRMADASPWQSLWDVLLPSPQPQQLPPDEPRSTDETYSL